MQSLTRTGNAENLYANSPAIDPYHFGRPGIAISEHGDGEWKAMPVKMIIGEGGWQVAVRNEFLGVALKYGDSAGSLKVLRTC
jgi:hypothetical protein